MNFLYALLNIQLYLIVQLQFILIIAVVIVF